MSGPTLVTKTAPLPLFVETLRELPDVTADILPHARHGAGKPIFDTRVRLTVAGRRCELLCEIKNSVFPRDVRELLWQLGEELEEMFFGEEEIPGQPKADQDTTPQLHVLVAASISSGAKDMLHEARVGYFDSGGSLYLPAPGAYLFVERPPPKPLAKSMRTLFAGKRAQVLHALLIRPQHWFGVTELARDAKASAATTSQVLMEVERFDWLALQGQGPGKERQLREPAALLDAWAKHIVNEPAPELLRYYVPGGRVEALMGRLAQACDSHQVGYAISHEAAAQRYAPFLSNVSQVRARMDLGAPAAEAALRDLGARPVQEGANLALIDAQPPGDLLFREQVDGQWLASPIHIYLDLLRGEARAKEMAEHFRQERIGF